VALFSPRENGVCSVDNLPASSAVVVQPNGGIVTAGFASDNTSLIVARYSGQ